VVLPLPPDGAGTRPVGTDGKIDESQSLGEASKSCGAGAGDGISPEARGWVSMDLKAGVTSWCATSPGTTSGMFATFEVTSR